MTLTIVVAAIIVITLALAIMAIPLGRRKAIAVGSQTEGRSANDPEAWPEASSEWDDEPQTRVIPRDPAITWPTKLDPRSSTLDDAARLRLIEDLGMLQSSWCVPILTRASIEEADPTNREAAQRALAKCREAAAG